MAFGGGGMLANDTHFNLVNQRFPHIGKKIESLWGESDCTAYLNDMLTDTRGHTRQGFPVEVASALFSLLQEHESSFPGKEVVVKGTWSPNNRYQKNR
jgi:hypothetical protein